MEWNPKFIGRGLNSWCLFYEKTYKLCSPGKRGGGVQFNSDKAMVSVPVVRV